MSRAQVLPLIGILRRTERGLFYGCSTVVRGEARCKPTADNQRGAPGKMKMFRCAVAPPSSMSGAMLLVRRWTPEASMDEPQHQPPELGGKWPQHRCRTRHCDLIPAAASGVPQPTCCEQYGMHNGLDGSVVQVVAISRPPSHCGSGKRHRVRVDVKGLRPSLSDAEQRPGVTRAVGRVDPAGSHGVQRLGPHPACHCNLEGRPGPEMFACWQASQDVSKRVWCTAREVRSGGL